MARLANRLNARKVATAGPGMHPDGQGLYLKVGPSGTRSWIFRYRKDGGRHDMGLGPANLLTLGEARDRAQQQRRLLRLEQKDPLTEKRLGQFEMITFEDAAKQYVQAHQAGWRNASHARDWWQSLRAYALPVLGKLPVSVIASGHVIRVLEPIWNTKTTTASRLRGPD